MNMHNINQSITILIADDDSEDRMLIKEALAESRLNNQLIFVEDGEQLIDYLEYKGEFSNSGHSLPGLILLDLNMPRKDGREALKEIKENPMLRSIPVVILTTSQAEEDILRTYNLGVSSFITKPVSFSSLVEIMKTLKRYWFEIVELPTVNEKQQ